MDTLRQLQDVLEPLDLPAEADGVHPGGARTLDERRLVVYEQALPRLDAEALGGDPVDARVGLGHADRAGEHGLVDPGCQLGVLPERGVPRRSRR